MDGTEELGTAGDQKSKEFTMSAIYCVPDYYIGVFLVIGFAVGITMPRLGRILREKYGWTIE